MKPVHTFPPGTKRASQPRESGTTPSSYTQNKAQEEE